MLRRWAGPLATALIVGGVGLVILMNLNWGPGKSPKAPGPANASGPAPTAESATAPKASAAPFREYPIGEEVARNHLRIAAVWLPTIEMEGMAAPSSSDVIHLEADVRATEGNPNGFAKDEFIPYLKIHYEVRPAIGGDPIRQGELMPMVARDGLHYGASIAMPKPGAYRLVYDVEPPSAGGLGRHSDPVTGVAPWWKPFRAEFDWDDYPGPSGR